MGEKGRVPYSCVQRPRYCSVYPSPGGVGETLTQSEIHMKVAQSPSCSLKDDWSNSIWFVQSHYGNGLGGKWTRGFTEHREICPNFQKEINSFPPPYPPPPHTPLLIPRFPQVLLGRELVWGPQRIFSPDCLESLTPGTYISADRLLSSVVLCRLDMELRVA